MTQNCTLRKSLNWACLFLGDAEQKKQEGLQCSKCGGPVHCEYRSQWTLLYGFCCIFSVVTCENIFHTGEDVDVNISQSSERGLGDTHSFS
jgi:hypothetical protein